MKKFLLFILSLCAISCDEPQQVNTKATYQVVERSKDIKSVYDWMGQSYKTETDYIMVLRNTRTNNVFATSVDKSTWYAHKEGQRFIKNYPYSEDH